ncbi:MAG: transglycosylase family protein [Acidimicrobiales bacterium]
MGRSEQEWILSHAAPDAELPARAPLPQWWWDQTLRTRRIIAGCIVFLLIAGIGAAVYALTDGEASADPVEVEARAYVAALPPQRVETWDELAECESEGDWAAATGNGFYGGLQFSQATWLEFGGTGGPHEAIREEQIMRAESVQEAQGWGAWPNCSAQLGLQD